MGKGVIFSAAVAGTIVGAAVGALAGVAINDAINEPVEELCSQSYTTGHLIGCVEKTGIADEFLFRPCGYSAVWIVIRREDVKPVPGGCGVSQ